MTGLKQEVKLKVLKSSVSKFEEAAAVALRIDSSLCSARRSSENPITGMNNGSIPVPMEIGNLESRRGTVCPDAAQRKKGHC